MSQLSKWQPGLLFMQVRHDSDCPAILSQRSTDCVCKAEPHLVTEKTWTEGVLQTRGQRRASLRAAKKAMRKAQRTAKD